MDSTIPLLSKSEISVVKLYSVTVLLSFCHNCLETSMFVFSRRRDTMLKHTFYSLYRLLTLKIRPRSPKYKQLFLSYQQCICASFIKICSLVQKIKSRNEISHLKKFTVTLKIKSRSPKSNQLFSTSQHCIYASLVKICPLVQKITPRNEISYITKGCCDLEN